MSSFTLEDYRVQRQYRENKRKQFIRRFQVLKEKMPLNNVPLRSSNYKQVTSRIASFQPAQHTGSSLHSNNASRGANNHAPNEQVEVQRDLNENKALKKELESIEAQERAKLQQFKQQISTIKQKYIEQIKGISALAQKNKIQTDEKMKKILTQMQLAIKKNEQIKTINDQLKEQLSQSDSTMGSYTTQIKNEYSKKLSQFENIFNSSNQKIQEMQNQFNQDQFVDNALSNQELLQNIQENASKSQQAVKILDDYKQLLAGKSEILKEISANSDMKQNQLAKMNELEGKMKMIFEKMNAEKRNYLQENQRMTKELLEIKELIMGFVSQGEVEEA